MSSPIAKATSQLSQAFTKLRPFIWVTALLLVALGFDFKTPSSQFSVLHADAARLDSSTTAKDNQLQADIDLIKSEHSTIGTLVTALAQGACLDRQPRETQLMGLDCPNLLHTQGNSTTTTTTTNSGGTTTRTSRP